MNLRTKLHQFTYYLFPGQCILCKSLTSRALDICLACESELPWLGNCCPYCAEPSTDILPCARCLQQPQTFSATLCGFEYRFPINTLIHAFKDSQHLCSGYVLTHLAYERHRKTLSNISVEDLLVVPVPLHPRKSRARGFNQSHLIAQQLAELIPATLDQTLLYRVIDTPDQKNLPLSARKKNLKDSFQVARNLKGNRVLSQQEQQSRRYHVASLNQALPMSSFSPSLEPPRNHSYSLSCSQTVGMLKSFFF